MSGHAGVRLRTNPITAREELVISALAGDPADPATSTFYDSLRSVADSLTVVQAQPSTAIAFSVVPRNAALVLIFDDLLDRESVASSSVRVLTGLPPVDQFATRLLVDEHHGDLVDGSFHSSRVIIDLAITAEDVYESEEALVLNPLGLPAAATANLPNALLRLPTIGTGLGERFVSNLAGRGLDPTLNEPADFESNTSDVVRAFRSGGTGLGDASRGFLDDPNPPRVVGEQAVQLMQPPVLVDPDEPLFLLSSVRFLRFGCATALRAGSILRQDGVMATIVENSPAPEGDLVRDVRVRLERFPTDWAAVGGAAAWENLAPTNALLIEAWDPDTEVDCCACFVEYEVLNETAALGSSVDPRTYFTVHFNEAMDVNTLNCFDGFTLGLGSAPADPYARVAGAVSPSPSLTYFQFQPIVPLAHEEGHAEAYWLRLRQLTGEPIHRPRDLAGNQVADALCDVQLLLDPGAATEASGSFVLRFDGEREISAGSDDWRGQHEISAERQSLVPRPVVHFTRYVDRNGPLTSLMNFFAPGVQTPLSALGSKLQTVWRHMDLGLAIDDEETYNLDVEGLSWAPANPVVQADNFPGFEIRLAHSRWLTDEALPQSGLTTTFAENVLDPAQDPLAPVHPRSLGYLINPAETYTSPNNLLLMPFPLNRAPGGAPPTEGSTYTWRDTTIAARGGSGSTGADTDLMNQVSGSPKLFGPGEVRTIGLPLLMEYRCFPDDQASGLNPLSILYLPTLPALPNFRAYSTGGIDANGATVIVNPDTEPVAQGGFVGGSGGPTPPADNTFYLGAADFVTRVSRSGVRMDPHPSFRQRNSPALGPPRGCKSSCSAPIQVVRAT